MGRGTPEERGGDPLYLHAPLHGAAGKANGWRAHPRGVRVKVFDLTVTDLGELAMALVDAATIVVGTPICWAVRTRWWGMRSIWPIY